MNKALRIAIMTLGMLIAPIVVSAETETPLQTEAQVFTACSQAAIELRDSTISSARSVYNTTMAIALDARKEAEKKAVAIDDTSAKKDAIKKAVEEYKESASRAQEILTKERKSAWASFEENTKNCREMNKEKREAFIAEKKEQTTEAKAEMRALSDDHKGEMKSLKETLRAKLDSLKNLFKKGE